MGGLALIFMGVDVDVVLGFDAKTIHFCTYFQPKLTPEAVYQRERQSLRIWQKQLENVKTWKKLL